MQLDTVISEQPRMVREVSIRNELNFGFIAWNFGDPVTTIVRTAVYFDFQRVDGKSEMFAPIDEKVAYLAALRDSLEEDAKESWEMLLMAALISVGVGEPDRPFPEERWPAEEEANFPDAFAAGVEPFNDGEDEEAGLEVLFSPTGVVRLLPVELM